VSKYLGKLDKEKEFIPKGKNKRTVAGPRNITEYGNSVLLHEMMKDIKPLLEEGFPGHWEDSCALAMVGVSGNNPSLNPKNLSNVLVYDLNSVFSRSMSITQAEKGYSFPFFVLLFFCLLKKDVNRIRLSFYLLYRLEVVWILSRLCFMSSSFKVFRNSNISISVFFLSQI